MFKKRSEFFDSNFVYFLILSFFVVIRIISSTFKLGEVAGYVLNFVIQVGLCLSLPLFLYSFLRKQKLKTTLNQYGFKKISLKATIVSFLIGILVYIVTIFIASFFSVVLSNLGYEKTTTSTMTEYPLWLFIIELLMTALLPGICEEVANRGMLIHGYKTIGAKKAILFSGLFFGLMHLNIEQFFFATILGFYFGFVALASDSIYPTMIMHFTNNAISTFMSYSIVNNLPIGSFLDNVLAQVTSKDLFTGVLILFVFITFIILMLLWLTKILCKETRVKRLAQVADQMLKQELRNDLLRGFQNVDVPKNQSSEIELNKQVINGKNVININFKKDMLVYGVAYKPTSKDKIFMYANLFLGIVLTICTFIWGII